MRIRTADPLSLRTLNRRKVPSLSTDGCLESACPYFHAGYEDYNIIKN